MSNSENIKQSIRNAYSRCRTALDDSYRGAVLSMEPGSVTPSNNIFHTPQEKANYIADGQRFARAALASVDASIRTAGAIAGAAPSADATNAVTMLSLNKDATEDDYALAMEIYGSNAMSAKAIASLARASGFNISNPNKNVDKYLEMVELRKSIESLLAPENIAQHFEAGQAAYAEFAISISDYSCFD